VDVQSTPESVVLRAEVAGVNKAESKSLSRTGTLSFSAIARLQMYPAIQFIWNADQSTVEGFTN
jgi:hypothetical protein